MDDETNKLLRDIRDSIRTPEEPDKGVFVSREAVEIARRQMERRPYLIAFSVIAAFCVGLVIGYLLGTGGIAR